MQVLKSEGKKITDWESDTYFVARWLMHKYVSWTWSNKY